jgi:serine protease Do
MRAFSWKIIFSGILAVFSICAEQTPSWAENEKVFSEAGNFTVKVRSVIKYPWTGDREGVFTGAGFVIDKKRGWIATNAHVTGRIIESVNVQFKDGQYNPAKLLFLGTYRDFAVVAVSPKFIPENATEAPIDCDGKPSLGVAVGAFGHPHGLDFTGTRGIISGQKYRWSKNWIQTDAAINPGNSGGPLIALETGKVIGINTSSYESSDGIGFAIPARDFCSIIDLLKAGQDPNPPMIPVALSLDHEKETGLNVMKVYEGTSVTWDLKEGDKLNRVTYKDAEGTNHEHELKTPADLTNILRSVPGNTATLEFERNKEKVSTSVPIKRWPSLLSEKFVHVSGAVIGSFERMGDAQRNPEKLLMVHSVKDSSAADVAGIKKYDLIKSVDGTLLNSGELLAEYLAKKRGQRISINVRRQEYAYRQTSAYKLIKLEVGEVSKIGR